MDQINQFICIFSGGFSLFLIFLNLKTRLNTSLLFLSVSNLLFALGGALQIWILSRPGFYLDQYAAVLSFCKIFHVSAGLIAFIATFRLIRFHNRKIKRFIYSCQLFFIGAFLLDFILQEGFFYSLKNWYLTPTPQDYVFSFFPQTVILIFYMYIALTGLKRIDPARKKIGYLFIAGTIFMTLLRSLEFILITFLIEHIVYTPLFYLSLYGLGIYQILIMMILTEEISALLFRKQNKYTTSSLDDKKVETCRLKIRELMEKERIYLDPDLTISLMAERLEIPRGYLSEFFNKHLKTTFYGFVNSYRVKALVLLFKQEPGGTILELGFKAGFNSKSTLNKSFKQETGCTPGVYRKRGVFEEG